jgi:hypothetical protein
MQPQTFPTLNKLYHYTACTSCSPRPLPPWTNSISHQVSLYFMQPQTSPTLNKFYLTPCQLVLHAAPDLSHSEQNLSYTKSACTSCSPRPLPPWTNSILHQVSLYFVQPQTSPTLNKFYLYAKSACTSCSPIPLPPWTNSIFTPSQLVLRAAPDLSHPEQILSLHQVSLYFMQPQTSPTLNKFYLTPSQLVLHAAPDLSHPEQILFTAYHIMITHFPRAMVYSWQVKANSFPWSQEVFHTSEMPESAAWPLRLASRLNKSFRKAIEYFT